MILELATVLALGYTPVQCPYVPVIDPPWRKYTCFILTRLGYPPDRPYLKGINPGGFMDNIEIGGEGLTIKPAEPTVADVSYIWEGYTESIKFRRDEMKVGKLYPFRLGDRYWIAKLRDDGQVEIS